MQVILDLDLDFFVRPPVYHVPERGPRPSDQAHSIWPAEAVAALLRRLGVTAAIRGRVVEHHVEALPAWMDAITRGWLAPPFRVVHVDAHEDLGYGDPLWMSFQEQVLCRPLPQRNFDEVLGLAHSGNFLLAAIALGWVGALDLVLPGPLSPDHGRRLSDLSAHAVHFMHGVETSGAIELHAVPGLPAEAQARGCRKLPWVVRDPPVPVRVLAPGEVRPATYSYWTVATSPAFCPPGADALLPVLTAWMHSDRCPEK